MKISSLVPVFALAFVVGAAPLLPVAADESSPPETPAASPAKPATPEGDAPSPAAPAPDEAVIVELQSLVARGYGGREAVTAFRGCHARGKVISATDALGGTMEMDLELNGSLRVSVRNIERTEVRILSGAMAWSGGFHHQAAAARELADSMRLQYLRLAAPFDLVREEPSTFVVLERTEKIVVLQRKIGSRLIMNYEVDLASGRVTRTEGWREGSDGERLFTFDVRVSDFKSVDSPGGAVLFPLRSKTLVDGRVISEVVLERITSREEFASETFLPADAPGDF